MNTQEDHEEAIGLLKDAYQKGSLVVFFGSGISLDGGIPGVEDIKSTIMNVFLKKCGLSDIYDENELRDINNNVEKLQFELFMQHIYEILGDDTTQKILKIFMGSDYADSPNHKCMISLENTSFVTVNMDSLFENCFNKIKNKDNLKIVVNKDQYELNVLSDKSNSDVIFVKLHGSLEEEYKDTYVSTVFDEGKLPEYKKNFLLKLFEDKTVWFIGYSLADLDVSYLLIKLAKDNKLPFNNCVYHCHNKRAENFKILKHYANNKMKITEKKYLDIHSIIERLRGIKTEEKQPKPHCTDNNLSLINCLEKHIENLDSNTISLVTIKIINSLGLESNSKILNTAFDKLVIIDSSIHPTKGNTDANKSEFSPAKQIIFELDLKHMIAQMRSEKARDIQSKYWNVVADESKNFINKYDPYLMRASVLRIESMRHCISTERDEEKKRTNESHAPAEISESYFSSLLKRYDALAKEAGALKNRYAQTRHEELFNILYYRCLNERAKLITNFGKESNVDYRYVFDYLEEYKKNPNITGELNVNGTALCILNYLEEFESDAALILNIEGRNSYEVIRDSIKSCIPPK